MQVGDATIPYLPCRTGDIIGVLFNQRESSVIFTLNDTTIGNEVRSLPGGHYRAFIAVSDNSEVAFNFGPDFYFPIEDFCKGIIHSLNLPQLTSPSHICFMLLVYLSQPLLLPPRFIHFLNLYIPLYSPRVLKVFLQVYLFPAYS